MSKYAALFTVLVVLIGTSSGQDSKAGQFIHVTDANKAGPQQVSIFSTLDFIASHADSRCLAALPMLKESIIGLEGDKNNPDTILIGHGKFRVGLIAFTGNDSKVTDEPAGFAMIVNDDGAFFHDGDGNGQVWTSHKYIGGSNQAKVIILLHELGHFLNAPGIVNDFGSHEKVEHNNEFVNKNCQSVIKAAGTADQF